MSGRRDSRVHLEERQSDALMEFENFKRKYLLVNKHITKLNSTLSVRVEELNTQISTLYSENLRLRASEVALKAQLNKEKQRSNQMILQTEHAIGTLMTQLSTMRTAHNVDERSPRSKRKPSSSPVQPPRETIRLVRPPADTITQIRESEEDDADEDDTPTRSVTSRRSSMSRLPLPKHTSYCPPPPMDCLDEKPREIDLETAVTRRKLGRRNSSLFIAEPALPRALSPVDGPVRRPRRRQSIERRDSLEDEEREVELQIRSDVEVEVDAPVSSVANSNDTPSMAQASVNNQGLSPPEPSEPVIKAELKQRSRLTKIPMEISPDPELQSASEREASDSKERDKRRLVIKDVTNSPRRPHSNLSEKAGSRVSSPQPEPALSDALTPKQAAAFISSITSTPATENGSENGYEMANQNAGRERRARKTLNYAEPKLNTKMRKPSPPLEGKPRQAGVTIRRRRSTSATTVSDEDGDADAEGTTISIKSSSSIRRKTVHSDSIPDDIQVDLNVTALPHSGWTEEGRRRTLAV